MFKSKFEITLNKQLKKLKADAKYEPFKLKYILECDYIPDWVLPNGIILEGKGKLDAPTRRKMVSVRAQNPGRDIRFIFQRANNRIGKRSSTTYGKWATKNGFKWSDGFVPKEWLKEKRA